MMRDTNRAKAAFQEAVAAGFQPDITFDLWEVIISFDKNREECCIAHLPVIAYPPPDFESVELRMTQVLPLSAISVVKASKDSLVRLELVFTSPAANKFNSKPSLGFTVAVQSAQAVRQLLASWPSTARIEREGI